MARDPSSAIAKISIVEITTGVEGFANSDCEVVMVFTFVYQGAKCDPFLQFNSYDAPLTFSLIPFIHAGDF